MNAHDEKTQDMKNAATKAVRQIVKDLTDRRGLRQEWDQIDDLIRTEIENKWFKIVMEAFGQNKS